jgi:hypothetical protein
VNAIRTSDLTVDIKVLLEGCQRSGPHPDASLVVVVETATRPDIKVAIDASGRIRQQYTTKLRNLFLGKWWIRAVIDSSKFSEVRRIPLPRHVRVKLEEMHFDKEDAQNYVRTAGATDSGMLLTTDPDYSGAVCMLVKRKLGVFVYNPQDGHERICGGEVAACLKERLPPDVPFSA